MRSSTIIPGASCRGHSKDQLGCGGTCLILREAAVQLIQRCGDTTVVADSGSENVNGEVDDVLRDEELTRVLAQVEVTFPNSMIEAFWRCLKHSWIYLHTLDNFAALGRLIEFYVTAHNEVMPHAAFDGQTPDEMYFGIGSAVHSEPASARNAAREERMRVNRTAACGVCFGETDSGALPMATATLQNALRRSWAALHDAARHAVVHAAAALREAFDDAHAVERVDIGRSALGAVLVREGVDAVRLFHDRAGAPLGEGFLPGAPRRITLG